MLTWFECLDAPDDVNLNEVREVLRSGLARCYPNKSHWADVDNSLVTVFLDDLLQCHYGSWARGWRYAASAGGLVSAWCCASHSITKNRTAYHKTFVTVAESVHEWHSVVRRFGQLFEKIDRECQGQTVEQTIETAVVELVSETVQINSGCDAWHRTFLMVLQWYFEHLGLAPQDTKALERILDGHFSSWVAPNSDEVRCAATDFGRAVEAAATGAFVDSTDVWLQARRVQLLFPPGVKFEAGREALQDHHLEFVRSFDYQRSEERGLAIEAALERCRADADAQRPLDWDLLCQWQAIILGRTVGFREGEAYAKQGQERYPLLPKTPKSFRNCLSEANQAGNPIVTARNAFGDVCFFHPFEDGNARAARLVMEYVLVRHKLALLWPDPVFRFARPAAEYNLISTLQCVVGKRSF